MSIPELSNLLIWRKLEFVFFFFVLYSATFTLASIKQLAEDNRVQIHSILVSLHHNFFSEIEICRFCVGISKNSNLTSLNISYCGLCNKF